MQQEPCGLFSAPGLPPPALPPLLSLPPEARCVLERCPGEVEPMQEEGANQNVLLEVCGEFIIERSLDRTLILSALRCDYDVKFEILRHAPPLPNRVGEPLAIRFYFPEHPFLQLLVREPQRRSLEQVVRSLGRRFIVQLGFHSLFKATKRIGKGMTACVYNAVQLGTGREVAVKSFNRATYFAQDNNNGKLAFLKEFRMLTQLTHPNICQLLGVYESDNSTYVVLEIYPNSLFGHLQKNGFPSLHEAKYLLIGLLQGVAYMHAQGVMHRDLKLENIMVRRDSRRNGRVMPVIIDLGLAEYVTAEKYLYVRCGTPGYVAPEVLVIKSADPVQTYSEACDMFSLGVILHILLLKRPVFDGKESKEVLKRNMECNIDFQAQVYRELPSEAVDLLRRMLAKQPGQRITAEEALQHPFVRVQRRELQAQGAMLRQADYQIQV